MEFEITIDREHEDGRPVQLKFESRVVYTRYRTGKLDEKLGITLDCDDHILIFYFKNTTSKQLWQNNELEKIRLQKRRKV
jgi:hypothetical protein